MTKSIASILLFLICLALSSNSSAQWVQTNGPFGGQIIGIASMSDGGNATDLYVSMQSGMFRSSDYANSWARVRSEFSGTMATIGQHLFTSSPAGVAISSDRGTTWAMVNEGLGGAGVYKLLTIGSTLYALSNNYSVYRSEDLGASWTIARPKTPGVIYSSVVSVGLTLFMSAYAASSQGVYRSTDNGDSWEAVNAGLTSRSVNSLVAGGSTIFAATADGYFFSTDQGESWTSLGTLLSGSITSLERNAAGDLLAVTSLGLFRSTNNGTVWAPAVHDLPDPNVKRLLSANHGFIAETPSGLFVSTNGGMNWTPVNVSWIGTTLSNLVSIPDVMSGERIFATSAEGVHVSANGGDTWSRTNSGLEGRVPGTIAGTLDDASQVTLFVGTDSGIYASADFGANWTPTSLKDAINLVTTTGINVLASTETGVKRSSDKGITWMNAGLDVAGMSVTAFRSEGNTIYAGTYASSSQFFSTTDLGVTWVESLNFPSSGFVYSLDAVGSTVVMGNYGVYRSTDQGGNWVDISSNLTHTYVFNVRAVDNGSGGVNIFAATDHGVFFLPHGSSEWIDGSTGLTAMNVYSLVVSGSHLYAAPTGAGIWKRPLSQFSSSDVDRKLSSSDMSITPNPTNGPLTVRGSGGGMGVLEIQNILGQRISQSEWDGTEAAVDLTGFPNGLYLIHTEISGVSQSVRVVKR
ncbi:MAG TPA: T9SS type A sorting domain-containing protein [Candidatus Kapabacteria bacterium]|nr:T9SS type A sorting domain-containing protein [Candidatus Kapabacteria bacterium]